MRMVKCVPRGVGPIGEDAGTTVCTCVSGSPETEPAAGMTRDHGHSFSDEVMPEIGLEGWMLARQERRILLAETTAGSKCKGL